MEKEAVFPLIAHHFPAPFGAAPIESAMPFLPCRAVSRIPERACCVLVFLFPYYTGDWTARNISRYAMIPDYHLVAGQYLRELCELLQQAYPEHCFEPFTDNSPLREVACANAAGLGVIGDNGLLIHPLYGSYVFIGEIVTDLSIPLSTPSPSHCIQCGACRRICPNGAIQEDGSVELSLCRSHITQKKGELTAFEEDQIKQGGLIWGCDLCNDICPLNRNPRITPIPEFLDSITPYMKEEEVIALLKIRPYNYRGQKTILRNYHLLQDSERNTKQ